VKYNVAVSVSPITRLSVRVLLGIMQAASKALLFVLERPGSVVCTDIEEVGQ
jgi:hypothetical protein